MQNLLNHLEYKVFKKYEKRTDIVTDYVWEYNKRNPNITQLEYNKTLNRFIRYYMREFDLDVIIASGVVCTIFDNFEDFHLILANDVYNYERFKSDIKKDFEPFFLIKEISNETRDITDKNIGIVIKSDVRLDPNNIILTNTDVSDFKVIDVWELPKIKLIECFKN
jgi:hypothetical protein